MENWDIPAAFSDKLLPGHAVFSEDALSLGGKWRFLGLTAQEELPDQWTDPDFADKKWRRISITGLPEAPELPNPRAFAVGLYRKNFILSREQGSRQIILRFEALPNPTVLWINGTCIGQTAGMGMPVEFDITEAVRSEKNVICLMIRRETGISDLPGNVKLYSLPARAITQLSADTRWQEDGTPLLQLGVSVREAAGFTLRVALMDNNRVLCYRECPVEDDHVDLLIPCSEVQAWHPEQPKCYRVAVILWDGVAMYHTRELTVGFRRAEHQEQAVLVNGQPEKVFAAEYSAIDPQTGCFLSGEVMESRLKALRARHINAILLSAPAPDLLYGLCDRIGMYILDCSASASEPEQNRRRADIFGSHPSILAWNALTDHPGILGMDRISIVPAFRADDSQTVLLSLLHSADGLEQLVQRVRNTPGILGAVFGSAVLEKESLLRELGALLQPVSFSYQDGTVTVTNLSPVCSTEGYVCRSILTRDGETVFSRELDLVLAPGETRSVLLETRYDIFKSGRYHLTVEYVHPESNVILASDQWEVGYLHHIFDENPGGTIREDQGCLLLRSEDASYTVNRTTGVLEQILIREKPLLPCAAWNVYTESGENTSGYLLSSEWEKLSIGRKKLKPSVFEVDHMTRTVSASYKLGSGLLQNFRLFSDGSISWELRLRTGKNAPELLGVCIPLDKTLDQFRWFGLGPDDADPEHRAGCFFGNHTQMGPSPAAGTKEPVYRLTVSDPEGYGLTIRSEDGLRVSFRPAKDCNQLRLELPVQKLTPHTTYNFSFTLQPVQA